MGTPVYCECCNSKPEDTWIDSLPGYSWFPQYSMWFCDDCKVRAIDDIEYGPRNQ
jgi:hypothetical protein